MCFGVIHGLSMGYPKELGLFLISGVDWIGTKRCRRCVHD